MTPIMDMDINVEVNVEVNVDMEVFLSTHYPIIECPSDILPKLKDVYIFTQWFSQITIPISITDVSLLTHFEKYITYISSKKCRAIRKTKEMFPYIEGAPKKKRVSKKPVEVLGTDGEPVVSEKKKRTKKPVEVVLGTDGEPVVAEKKKRTKKPVEAVLGPDGEPVVTEKKKRVYKKKEVNVEVSESDTENVVSEKKKRVYKKKEEEVVAEEVAEEVAAVVVEKKKNNKTKAVAVEKTEKKNKKVTVDTVDTNVVEPKKRKITKKNTSFPVEDSDNEAEAAANQLLQEMELEMEE